MLLSVQKRDRDAARLATDPGAEYVPEGRGRRRHVEAVGRPPGSRHEEGSLMPRQPTSVPDDGPTSGTDEKRIPW